MAQTLHVAAAIIQHDGKILACQRGYGPMKDGWEFPGGKVKEGETAEEACRREVQEELGARLGVAWYLDTVEYDYPDFHLSMDCFVAELARGQEPKLLEHEASRWLAQPDLLNVDWLPADKDLVTKVGVMWDQIFSPEHL